MLEAVAHGRAVDDWDPVKVSCFRPCATPKLLVSEDGCAAELHNESRAFALIHTRESQMVGRLVKAGWGRL